MQEGITDLEEDTRQKLTQTWEAMTKGLSDSQAELAKARADLAQSDSSLMELVKALGEKLEQLELKELPDMVAHVDEMGETMLQELHSACQAFEESIKVAEWHHSLHCHGPCSEAILDWPLVLVVDYYLCLCISTRHPHIGIRGA
jgi:hypothetical protein